MIIRVQIQVRGIVQGVGFRPFIYALALKNSLVGRVFNNQSGVLIDVEGESRTINHFLTELKTNPPSLARIESTDTQEQSERAYYDDFRIDASTSAGPKFVPISPDVATCADCLRELFDPRDRRFRYPFSMGRLFDAVSSLLRLRDKTNYEGQAAIELEQIADSRTREGYKLEVSEDGSIIRPQNVIRRAVEDLLSGVPPRIISARFHLGVAELIANIACKVRDERKLNRVVLSGGVFQNMFLLRAASAKLTAAGFEVFAHRRVPANDGGISLGQAAIANARLQPGSARFQRA